MKMTRNDMIRQVESHHQKKWDVVIIGGGATGLGCAVDSASRGYKTLLLEKNDFAAGTSSKATKLAHGGVRYLKQGHIRLVTEALRERGYMYKNAPHLVSNITLSIPAYSIFRQLFYYIGLYIYETLARDLSFGPSRLLSRKTMLKQMPTLKKHGLAGGISYHDGQFDDSRLAVELMLTAADHGATMLNYAEVTGFIKDEKGTINGLYFTDLTTQTKHEIHGKSFINATGVFADSVLQMDEPGKKPTIVASQGSHIIVDKKFLPGKHGLMIPKTSDGRVLFMIPWHEACLIGTTDNPVKEISIEPKPLSAEIDFMLETAARYLDPAPGKEDILSVFAGLRPLAAPADHKKKTKEISRSHKVTVSPSGLINIIGGKWTTYRKMAEDTLNITARTARLIHSDCRTKDLPLHGFAWQRDPRDPLFIYGINADHIHEMQLNNSSLRENIHPQLPYTRAEAEWCILNEMTVTLEDLLARRMRCILLNAKATLEVAPEMAKLMAHKLNKDQTWIDTQVAAFTKFAANYMV